MTETQDQSADDMLSTVWVENLPFGISAKEITNFFHQFGYAKNLFLKRRTSKNSDVYLKNPRVVLVFEHADCVSEIMRARPLFMQDHELFIRRCFPLNSKYSQEAFLSVNQILIRTISETNNDVLPDDKSIVDYLSRVGGKIESYERLNDQNFLVQFNDYDPVDLCCLLRPHFINNQQVEVEKCRDEEEVRFHLKSQQKLSTSSAEQFSSPDPIDFDIETMNTISTTPILSIEDQMTELRLMFHDRTSRLEHQHEQSVAQLTNQWKQTAKERIRLQRLTLDHKQEIERLIQENKQLKELDNDSLKERTIVQKECKQRLQE